MSTFTLTTTPEQDALLAFIVRDANRQRETNLTVDQYIAMRFPELLAPYVEGYKTSIHAALAANYESADAATKQQVLQLLKVS